MLAISKPQVPDFYKDDPKTWFFVVEAEFKSFSSCSDNTKFSTVIKALDSATLKQITDILSHPPDQNKYEAVKKAILDRFTDSRQKEIRKLLKGMTLSDRKPSDLLREMRDIAGDSVNNDILHQFWLDCLPTDLRPFLVVNDDENLDTLAKVADRIIESRSSFVMSTATTINRIDPLNRNNQDLERRIEEMQHSLATCLREVRAIKEQQFLQSTALQTQLLQMPSPSQHYASRSAQHQRQQSYQTSQNQQSRSRSKSRSRIHDEKGVCFYHQRFGDSARYCTLPCTFKPDKQDSGN